MKNIKGKIKKDLFITKMKYIKTLGCKLKISARRLGRRLWNIITDALAVIGALVMIAEAASGIFKYQGIFEFYRINAWWITATIILVCVFKNWDRLKCTVKIADSSDITITLKVCDALKNEGAIIIPTNSTFDTVMDDEFISEGSVQGQYQIKYFKDRLFELDKKIEEGLAGRKCIELKDDRKHNSKRYPIGTVSRVSENNKRAYFLADSDIDSQGHPMDVDVTDISQALTGLWHDISRIGNSEPYSIPLIGTGKARVKDMSRNDVIQHIILSFLAASKEHKITESLTICIHPEDFEKIDWDGLCVFLKYQCQYANRKPTNAKPVGTPETLAKVISQKGEQNIDEYNKDLGQCNSSSDLTYNDEHMQKMLVLLTGNKLSKMEIASAMGLSIAGTNRLLKKLQDDGLIIIEGPPQRRLYCAIDS